MSPEFLVFFIIILKNLLIDFFLSKLQNYFLFMNILSSALKKLLHLKYLFLILLLLFVTNSLFEQFLMKKLEFTLRGSESATLELFVFGGLNLFISLFFPVVTSLLTIFYFMNPSKFFFVHIRSGHIEAFVIETLRSWGKMIWWGFLLILPGFYKYLSFCYVPFVVLMNKNYELGLVDALKESERVFRSKKLASLSTLIIFQLVLPIMLSSLLDSYRNFNETPWLALVSSVLQGTISLFGFLVLMEIYTRNQ